MKQPGQKFLRVTLILLGIAVVLGAFGAHALKARLSSHYLEVWETANRYHFYHALGLLVIITGLKNEMSRLHMTRVCFTMLTGIVLFSGSLYLLSLSDFLGLPSLKILGAITPIGGVCFVTAWLYAAYALIKS